MSWPSRKWRTRPRRCACSPHRTGTWRCPPVPSRQVPPANAGACRDSTSSIRRPGSPSARRSSTSATRTCIPSAIYAPTLRWGTDITVTFGGRQLRLLSVHLKSGCWSAEQDSDPSRTRTCATLSDQILELRDWADLREDEGVAFGILGDFNRRFAVSDDRAWSELSPESSPLELLTADLETACDPRFAEFIDHIVLDADAAALLVPESTREWPARRPGPPGPLRHLGRSGNAAVNQLPAAWTYSRLWWRK